VSDTKPRWQRAVQSVHQPRQPNATRKDRHIACRDLAGRRQNIVVFADAGRVVLIAPPGETAVLDLLEVDRLRAELRDAIAEAAEHSR
jgi:hypothetical protein